MYVHRDHGGEDRDHGGDRDRGGDDSLPGSQAKATAITNPSKRGGSVPWIKNTK